MAGKKRSPFFPRKRGKKDPFQKIIFVGIWLLIAFIFWQNWQDLLPWGSQVAQDEIYVHFIDVGQGDSILIRSAGHAVLIDAGPTAALPQIQRYLEDLGITVLDYVVATHPHSDHIGGMAGIIDRFEIRSFWMPDAAHDTAAFERMMDALERRYERTGLGWLPIQAGDRLNAGIIQMTAVAPNRSGYSNLNDYSIVLRMVHGTTAFLFTGDAEAVSENEILAAGWDIAADIMQAAHHGSRTSTSQRFLEAVGPMGAVISVGAGNQFGHPHPDVINRLWDFGVQEIFRTDEQGTVVFITDGRNIYVG